jgi:hypothetical protein
MANELAKVQKAAAAVDDAVARLERARGELRAAIASAEAAAWTFPSIADAAGMSKQRVHQIVARVHGDERATAQARAAAVRLGAKARRGVGRRGQRVS